MPKWLKNIVALTYPFWGPILIVAIESISPKSNAIQVPLLMLGIIGLLFSAFPIFYMKDSSTVEKVMLAIVYYIVAFIPIFFIGWQSMCWFTPPCR